MTDRPFKETHHIYQSLVASRKIVAIIVIIA